MLIASWPRLWLVRRRKWLGSPRS